MQPLRISLLFLVILVSSSLFFSHSPFHALEKLTNNFPTTIDNESSAHQPSLAPAYAQTQNRTGDSTMLHNIDINGTEFTVQTVISSGAKVRNVTLDTVTKTLMIEFERVENISRVQFITLIFKSEMLGGPYTVFYEDALAKRNQHYAVSIEKGYAVFGIAFPRSIDNISVIGTTVAPEFPPSVIIAGIGMILVLAAMQFRRGIFHNK